MLSDFRTVEQVAEMTPGITEWQLRDWIKRRDDLGLSQHKVLRKVGRRWLIHLPRFEAWLDGSSCDPTPQQSARG